MRIPERENQESLKKLKITGKKFNKCSENPERKFDFKVKVIQTDLTAHEDFYNYFRNLNESSIPFIVQHSGYIEKLDYMNRFGGGTLASENDNISVDKYFGKRIFQVDIANPQVLAEAERRKEAMFKDIVNTHGTPEVFVRDLLEKLMDGTEEWEFEDVDIPGNLYMFDMMNKGSHSDAEYNEEEYEDDYEFDENEEEYDDFEELQNEFVKPELAFHNNLEVKFNVTGSIKFLENNMLEVKYDESDMTGIKDAFVRFLFDCEKKDFVTIHRCGHSDTWLNCEKGERVSGMAKSRSFGSSVTVDTKEIINNMTPDGGQLYISYIRETNGAPSEMVTHIISASPCRE